MLPFIIKYSVIVVLVLQCRKNKSVLFLSQVLFTGDIERCEAALYLAKRVCGAGGTHLRSLKDNH